ncbi:patatin-like phospholipase family protein [Microbulbifer echini]|uniref:Patatin-like phospholipase family protein n=1 Tax=Microbulbifer echini TaxID=1529067 RepID=A0ABV4NTJ0_9GAMM|nr:patatin-like phospholipase family protein [uncultured Microbulbifer sp.]
MKTWHIPTIIVVTITFLVVLIYVYNNRLTQSIQFNAHPVTEEFIESNQALKDKDTINILIIDGGGIRGLIPLYVLQHIEREAGKPIDELFDVFSGASIGAIIATGLNVPHIPTHNSATEGQNIHSKSDKIIQIYKDESEYLFSVPWYHKILTANGLLSPRFIGERLSNVMEENYTKEMNFTDLKNYVIVPSLNIHTGQLTLFKNRGKEVTNLPTNTLYQLVTAASSAESLFPPVEFMTKDQDIRHRYFADAGIDANNPASIVLLDIIREFPGKNYYVLILGAGTSPLKTMDASYKKVKNWGKISWTQDLISNVQRSMDSQQLYTLEIARSLSPKGKIDYNYLNIEINNPYVAIFDYKSVDKLETLGEKLINENQAELDQVLKHLQQGNKGGSK